MTQKNSVYIVYTRWKNLKKTASMVDGQVGYHRPENVRRMEVEKNNSIVRQIEKTKVEEHPDLYAQQQARQREIQQEKKAQHKRDLKAKQAAAELPHFEYQGEDLSLLYKYVLSPLASFCVNHLTPIWLGQRYVR